MLAPASSWCQLHLPVTQAQQGLAEALATFTLLSLLLLLLPLLPLLLSTRAPFPLKDASAALYFSLSKQLLQAFPSWAPT